MKKIIKVALAGNPNSGKTTVFNNLTGAHQRVGNYPGVTVEKKTGRCSYGEFDMEIVDLPGTYGLSPYSLDEKVARDFIINERPDVVVNVIDSSNVERNLYLTTQLMELDVPLLLAFNMRDVAESRGIEFNLDLLSGHFGAPIVSLVGHKNKGTVELLAGIECVVQSAVVPGGKLRYGRDIEREIGTLETLVESDTGLTETFSSLYCCPSGARWLAMKLLEDDDEVAAAVGSAELSATVQRSIGRLSEMFDDTPAILIADRRYGYISGACQEAVRDTVEIRHTSSDRADTILTHPVLGLPIFLFLMYLVFNVTFTLGSPIISGLEALFAWLGGVLDAGWPQDSYPALKSLFIDGIIGGVGGVIVFLPNILLLFMAIAVLEYSGYMARAAFIMDRLMHKIGLHGKSFIPMLIGFGCSVPAVMATRTLDSRRDRLVTILIIPLMSCGARLPIYALIIPAFFDSAWHSTMLWLIYVIGILLAVASAKLLGMTVFREKTPGMVMELPPYRIPTLRSVWIQMWERSWLYLKKAGTIILGISIVMWAMTRYPRVEEFPAGMTEAQMQAEQMAYSVAGRMGRSIEPVIRPMGFDWKIGTALIGAIAAKEVFVAQLAIVNSLGAGSEGSDSLREVLRRDYSPLVGFCIMLFSLIGFPCMATCAVSRLESGSWKWALFQFVGLTLMAYILTVIVFQVGSLL